MTAEEEQIATDLALECERRISQVLHDFDGLMPNRSAAYFARLFVATNIFGVVCGIKVAMAGKPMTGDNLEDAAKCLLDGMLPAIRKSAGSMAVIRGDHKP